MPHDEEEYRDPFERRQKRPAVSWSQNTEDNPHALAPKKNQVFTFVITDRAKLLPSRDYDTDEPKFWPPKHPGEEPQPVMAAVLGVRLDGSEDEMALWATKPSALFNALADAQEEAGEVFDKGGKVHIKYLGTKKNPDFPKRKPAHQFAAKYEPPVQDAFSKDADEDQPPF